MAEEIQIDRRLEKLVNNIDKLPGREYTGVVLPADILKANLGILTKNVWYGLQTPNWVGVQVLDGGPVGQVQLLDASRRSRIELGRRVVEARTLRYSAKWVVTDSGMGFDRDLTKDMVDEIDQDILMRLRHTAPVPCERFDASTDDHHRLALLLSLAALEIGFRSNRWGAEDRHFAVLSQEAYDIAARHPLFDCGRLWLSTGKMRLDVDPHATVTTPILVGYKGPSEVDTGMVWAPYQLIAPGGVIMDPNNFDMVMCFHQRFGTMKNTNAENYYRLIDYRGTPDAGL